MNDVLTPSPVCRVPRLPSPLPPNAVWDRPPWDGIPELPIAHFMGEQPTHQPDTRAKVAYDADAISVIFRVHDRYVRAVADELHGPVWDDSCVEFFFTPGADVLDGYFNLEMNCGGVLLLRHQKIPREDPVFLDRADCEQVQIAHTLPSRVDPERTDPTTWCVEFRLPVSILATYAPVVRPAPGVTWRANLFKCADATSHPHWLTWAPVNRPQPDFHVPECFGTLLFE